MALLPDSFVNKHEEVSLPEARKALRTGVWGDDPALKLVIQDANRAENYTSTKEWVMNWMTATMKEASAMEPRW